MKKMQDIWNILHINFCNIIEIILNKIKKITLYAMNFDENLSTTFDFLNEETFVMQV